MDLARKLLKQYYGYDDFKIGQEEIINKILSHRDTLAIMPTGAGKSVCFQIPALILDGITLVISPLISLMKDQVMSLIQNGIRAAYINSSLTPNQCKRALDNACNGLYKIIYIAPERLNTYDINRLILSQRVSLIAIDEAHCVSQWGHDFRPSYRLISEFIKNMPYRPCVCAFTATATETVKNDILSLLDLQNPYILTTSFDRPNLYYEVIQPKNKFEEIRKLLVEFQDKSGIIYCSTRKNTDKVYIKLKDLGYSVGKYHAGMTDIERKNEQESFVFGDTDIMVATNAFGMGIDKSDVSFVIHYNMPQNIESYYQEAGRAGRDGQKAKCILMYSPSDVITNKILIENNKYENVDEATKNILLKRSYDRLNHMSGYCSTTQCLRKYILNYFGQTLDRDCGNCFNCTGNFQKEDVTDIAIEIISCISNLGERYGRGMIAKVLLGVLDERTEKNHIKESTSFGRLSNTGLSTVNNVLDELLIRGYIINDGDKYPIIKITDKVENLLKGNEAIIIRKVETSNAKKSKTISQNCDNVLFDLLSEERKKRAKAQGIPPFMVFSNATLEDMANKKPLTRTEMLDVNGVGYAKLQAYGQYFIKIIKDYIENDKKN